jgi:hypothetical protein
VVVQAARVVRKLVDALVARGGALGHLAMISRISFGSFLTDKTNQGHKLVYIFWLFSDTEKMIRIKATALAGFDLTAFKLPCGGNTTDNVTCAEKKESLSAINRLICCCRS